MKKKQSVGPRKKKTRHVVNLEDLMPRKAVVGGSGKLLFGERLDPSTGEGSVEETETKDRRD